MNLQPLGGQPDTLTIVLIGDVMMHARQLDYDCRTFLEPIRSRLEAADIAIANMEFTLAGAPYSGYPAFSAPDAYADYVADCGVDVFLMANNHILDKGRTGLQRTLGKYRAMDRIRFAGAAETPQEDSLAFPLMLTAKGLRIALINTTYGTNTGDPSGWPKVHTEDKAEIAAAVRRARNLGADWIIALPHWGLEYQLKHAAGQEKMARWLHDAGVDAVIGAHPHVVQDEHERPEHPARTHGHPPLYQGPVPQPGHAGARAGIPLVHPAGHAYGQLRDHRGQRLYRTTRPLEGSVGL